MYPGFKFHLGEGAAPTYFGYDFLEAAFGAFADGNDVHLPTLLGGVAFVHAEQIAGEEGSLVAAGAGADFEDDIALIHCVFRNEREANLLFEPFLARDKRRLLRFRELAHLGTVLRVRDQRVEIGDFGFGGTIGFDDLDGGRKLSELARELDVSLRRKVGRHLVFHQRVAGNERVELLLRQRGQSCRPSAAANFSSCARTDTLPTGFSKSGRTACSPLRQSRSSSSAFTGPTIDGDSENER